MAKENEDILPLMFLHGGWFYWTDWKLVDHSLAPIIALYNTEARVESSG